MISKIFYMSLEKELDSVLSEALPPRRDPPSAHLAGQFPARKQPAAAPAPKAAAPAAQPTSPQKKKDFASIRKGMRKPMVNADAQIHNIDKMLNVTQKDPSQLGSTVQQMEKSFDSLLEPLKQVRGGVRQLKQAADEFGADYVPGSGQEEPAAPQAPAKTPSTVAPVRRSAGGDSEERFINKTVTDVEMVNNEKDKLAAAKQGWEEYAKNRGKMNRGEFYRALVQKLRLPTETQPQESSVQRRKRV